MGLQDQKEKKKSSSDPSKDDACERCLSIHRSDVATVRPMSAHGVRVAAIPESHDVLKNSSCPVCRLLATIKPAIWDGEECQLQAHLASDIFPCSDERLDDGSFNDSIVACIRPADSTSAVCHKYGFISVLGPKTQGRSLDFGVRMTDPNSARWGLVTQALDTCRKKHGTTCSLDPVHNFQGFHVIDCTTKSVVELPEHSPYVALSYARGSVRMSAEDATRNMFAMVVEDAIFVTNRVGFRYLWVDKYCIRSKNDMERHAKESDRIYSRAQITIVVAAGDNANQGIPGVSRPRTTQQRVEITNGLSLTQIFPHESYTVQKSRWAKRAWTYHEGYVSRRRLIFTENQVSFLCGGAHCTESVRQPLDKLTSFTTTLFDDLMPSFKTRSEINTRQAINRHIRACASRRVANPWDAYFSCVGILNSYERARPPTYHLWGIPTSLPTVGFFYHKMQLAWYHEQPATRNLGFPSWSWAGWLGVPNMNEDDVQVTRGLSEFQVDGHPPGRASIDNWLHFHIKRSTSIRDAYFSHEMEVTGPVVKLSFYDLKWREDIRQRKTMVVLRDHDGEAHDAQASREDGLHCVLTLSDRVKVFARVFLDEKIKLEDGAIGMVFSGQNSATSLTTWYVMILKKTEHYHERVGLAILRFHQIESDDGPVDLPPAVYFDRTGNKMGKLDISHEDLEQGQAWLDLAERKTIVLR